MSDFKNRTDEAAIQMQQYFSQLPSSVQESIMQSGVQIESMQDLERCARNFLQN